MLIHGITIKLWQKTEFGVRDRFNRLIKTDKQYVSVDNVLVQPLSEQEIQDMLNMTGRKAVYRLCLPKGDSHDWTDARVSFFGADWRVVGDTIEYIEDLVPLAWNKQIRVEKIDG